MYKHFSLDTLEQRLVLSTYTVTNTADSGPGSLRQAIVDAEAHVNSDIVVFASTVKGTIALSSPLTIRTDLTIQGPGSTALAISAQGLSRVFDINSSTPGSSRVTLSGLTIRDGVANGADTAGDGGGIYSVAPHLSLTDIALRDNSAQRRGGGLAGTGEFTLANCVIEGNRANIGGGIQTVSFDNGTTILSPVSLTDSMVRYNTSSTFGGGIDADQVQLTRTAVSANTAHDGGGVTFKFTMSADSSTIADNFAGAFGGGIYAPNDLITLLGTTVSGNQAQSGGGAYFGRSGHPSSLTNSTISGNRAQTGAGLFVVGPANILFCTIADNVASGSGGGLLFQPAVGAPDIVVAISSLFAGNAANGAASDIEGTALDATSAFNLVEDGVHTGGLGNGVNSNLVGVAAQLGPIGSNGGATKTYALLSGSPAIDHGAATESLTTDQRGAGFARQVGVAPDIGAFEFAGSELFSVLSGDGNTTSGVSNPVSDAVLSVTINPQHHPIVFETASPWAVRDLFTEINAPAAVNDIIVWNDARDGLTYAAYSSLSGLQLLKRSAGGTWSIRNLSTETQSTTAVRSSLTQFAAADGTVVIAGLSVDGDIVIYQENGATTAAGRSFAFKNVTKDDLTPHGFTSPAVTKLISYRTAWDSWHLAGIDNSGQIWSVWVAPATFTIWRSDNLSIITGAPVVSKDLTVLLTSWSGINLTALDAGGKLSVTWWVPSFGSQWQNDNLSDIAVNAVTLNSLSGFVTPWGGMNYVGLSSGGQVVSYWWVPSFGQTWVTSDLTGSVPATQSRPVSALTSYASAQGTFNIFGSDTQGNVLRTWWSADANDWSIDNVSENAVRA